MCNPALFLVGPGFPLDGDQKPVGQQFVPRIKLTIDDCHDRTPSASMKFTRSLGKAKGRNTMVKAVSSTIDLRYELWSLETKAPRQKDQSANELNGQH